MKNVKYFASTAEPTYFATNPEKATINSVTYIGTLTSEPLTSPKEQCWSDTDERQQQPP